MPALDTLAQLTQVAETWAQDGAPLQSLVDSVYPVMQHALPELSALHLYQITQNQLTPINGGDPLPLDSSVVLPAKVGTRWLLPLTADHVMVAQMDPAADPTPGAEWVLNGFTGRLAAIVMEQSNVFGQVSQFVTETATVRTERVLFEKVCNFLASMPDVQHVAVVLPDDSGEMAQIAVEHPARGKTDKQISLDQPLYSELRQSNQPVVVTDIATDSRLSQQALRDLSASGARSVIYLPIFDSRSLFLGVVGLELSSAGGFTSTHSFEVTQAVVAQMAALLQNVRLTTITNSLARQMEGIAGFGQSVQATFEVQSLFEITLLNMAQIFPVHHVGISMYSPTTGTLRVVAYQGEDGMPVVDSNGMLPELNYGGTTAEHVWNTRDMLLVTDLKVAGATRYTFGGDMRSSMSAPLLLRGTAGGILEVANNASHAFGTVESAVFQQLVSQLSVALENSETYSQSQELARSKSLVNDITSQIQQNVNINDIMQVTVRELGRALGAKRARIVLSPDTADEQTE